MHLGFSSMNTINDPTPTKLAPLLEAAGFESLWYGEHSHIPMSLKTPYPPGGDLPEPYKGMMDPYVSLTAAAAVTTHLKLGTGIALMLERDIFSQAKAMSTLDRLSNGRLMIGTGVGWNQEEFENVSRLPWSRRYLGLKETVAATRTLFTEAEPAFKGELIQFDPVWFEPKPAQENGPPIIFGAMGPLGIKHAAQWADGWMPVDIALPNIPQAISDFKKQVTELGRNASEVEITMVVMSEVTEDLLLSYQDMGIDRCNIGVGMANWDKPDIIEPMIQRFADLTPRLK